ncbi:MAG: PPOX class F420-dependent oxidoreductase [Mycobacteriales bacterium]
MGINQRASITMNEAEIAAFIDRSRTCTLATVGAAGTPHLVAMWYAVLDGQLWFETKAKSQKARNLQRQARASVLIEDGSTYDRLRGVSLEGQAVLVDDPAALWRVGVSIWERYTGPYSEEMKPFVELMLHKRVAVRLEVERTRSWDHRKLGMDPMPYAGSTADPA